MKILHEGSNELRWIGQCRICKAIVEATYSEIAHVIQRDRLSTSQHDEKFAPAKCPTCSDIIRFVKMGSCSGQKIMHTLSNLPVRLENIKESS